MSAVELVPPPPPARGRFWLRSLQSRLVFGVVGLVLVLVVAIGASTYFALRSFLFDRLDQQVTSVAISNTSSLSRCLQLGVVGCPLGDPGDDYRAPQTEWLTVLTDQGVPVVQVNDNHNLKQLVLSPTMSRAVVADPTVLRGVT